MQDRARARKRAAQHLAHERPAVARKEHVALARLPRNPSIPPTPPLPHPSPTRAFTLDAALPFDCSARPPLPAPPPEPERPDAVAVGTLAGKHRLRPAASEPHFTQLP